MSSEPAELPWYKHPWLLFVIALPTIAVIAGIATVIISFNVKDDIVDPHYYEDGLAINNVLNHIEQARESHMRADIQTGKEYITIAVSGDLPVKGDTLMMNLKHPLNKDEDRQITLARIDDNHFRAHMPDVLLHNDKWYIDIYPPRAQKPWLIKGTAFFPAKAVSLTP